MLKDTPPSTLAIFFVSIALISPIIEEVAFRGMLQNALKKRISTTFSILITSCLFSFLHLSIHAGISNLPLFFSLFTFSCLLGFLYERQRSLFAPIGLHIMFNSINLVSILFFK
ncbi:hypothetical protein COB21_00280 [Candidatus Aerophobetes bacterium]|uniref:CAAX prenyl protease 2/Lysostaphin resistance protein A-like domain-containing protein n=1 Tax=Aerophobetes bacterium TaxID=2030807 RepID=A0A2A4X7K9_UNCAE|nr:MAG: hypothetical protein COB21_00280 [Candidatus Aerophobetes bacterium]